MVGGLDPRYDKRGGGGGGGLIVVGGLDPRYDKRGGGGGGGAVRFRPDTKSGGLGGMLSALGPIRGGGGGCCTLQAQ